ncbi:hypothetical protein JVU11DRAFT_8814 [Chiua virens]|nr:hypothetical protein JVU11DRAFT_8814 [Chiua virens]
MDLLNALVSPSNCKDPDDALKMLGRVADAFDNPSLHKADKELLFVVNVAKPRQLLPVRARHSDLSFKQRKCFPRYYLWIERFLVDTSYDEDVEVIELGDVGVWEHTTSYPYASRRGQPQQLRSFSDRAFREDDGVYDVTKMLLTSSPLDRLDRLARMELKKTGWVERADKWSVVEMGLQNERLPKTPPKTPYKHTRFHVGENQQRSSSPLRSAKAIPPKSEKQASRSPLSIRPQTGGQWASKREHDHALERNQHQGSTVKSDTPTSMRSRTLSQGSDSYMDDFSARYSNVSHASPTTPIRAPRFSRALEHPQTQLQTGGRLGQVVRNFVKRMLPPSSGGGASQHSASHSRPRTGNVKGSPTTRTCETEMTPRSDMSGGSAWTFASAGMWLEGTGQGCLEYQTSNRWSGFWR